MPCRKETQNQLEREEWYGRNGTVGAIHYPI